MLKLDLKELHTFFSEKKLNPQIQEQTNQIYIVYKEKGREFPMFVRIFNEGLLQLLVFMPYQISPKVLPDLSRLLHLINRELDIPGFALDELTNTCFYRTMIPVYEGEIQEKILSSFADAIPRVCISFAPAIEAIISQRMTFDQLFKAAKEKGDSITKLKA